ncbi:MAG TPA: tRNA pseudouridine(13) synthase TruD [Kofleriaceae bacterium]|nr:tRNA pseudouridine(13) synthase TruD [Kofleriaceae bacterium]
MADALPDVPLPMMTAELPGIGGRLRAADDDFEVEEVPAYPLAGEGDHVWVWIEKRGLTTPVAAALVARAARVPVRDVGWAGMKDRHAVTRQWLSLPPPARPEAVADLAMQGLRVLAATRHRHKLRTGHLAGNRFILVVRDVGDEQVALARAQAILAALATPAGALNWYGEQRFGRGGDNATAGLDVIRRGGRGPGAPRQRRFLVSALQSYLFNRWLAARVGDGLLTTALTGDVLQKRGSGGQFVCEDPDVDGARLAAGDLTVTGPMFGAQMRAPPDGSPAHAREAVLLGELSLDAASFRAVASLAPGTRRAATIVVGAPEASIAGPGALRLAFTLPSGAYATAIARELMKVPPGAPAAAGGVASPDAGDADADALDDEG